MDEKEELSLHDPRNKWEAKKSLLKLYELKFLNVNNKGITEVTDEELQLRKDYDVFLSSLMSAEKVTNEELLKSLGNDQSDEFWNNLYYLELLIKSGRKFTAEEASKCYMIKYRAVQKIAKFDDLKEMEIFSSSDSIKQYATSLMSVMKMKLEDPENITKYVIGLHHLKFFDDVFKYFIWINNSISIIDLFDAYKYDSKVIRCVDDSCVSDIVLYGSSYFENYTDDNLSTIVTRALINNLLNMTRENSLEDLIQYTTDYIEKYKEFDVSVNDTDIINYALGQCQKMINQ